MQRALVWNSIVWAAVMLASAVVLRGADEFIGVLIVLISGAVASDAVIARAAESEDRPG